MAVDADELWQRVAAQEREFFKTPKGRYFTYRLDGDAVLPSQSDLRIPRSDFETAFPLLPLPDPRKLAKFVTGHEYVFAILHDERVRKRDW